MCVIFRVFGDGKLLYEVNLNAEHVKNKQHLTIDVSEVEELIIETEGCNTFNSYHVFLNDVSLKYYNNIE